jgi:hypothetical protein
VAARSHRFPKSDTSSPSPAIRVIGSAYLGEVRVLVRDLD